MARFAGLPTDTSDGGNSLVSTPAPSGLPGRLPVVLLLVLAAGCASWGSPAEEYLADDVEILDLVSAQGGSDGAVIPVSAIPEGAAIFDLLAPEYRETGRFVQPYGSPRFDARGKTCGFSINVHSATRSAKYGEPTASVIFSCPPA